MKPGRRGPAVKPGRRGPAVKPGRQACAGFSLTELLLALTLLALLCGMGAGAAGPCHAGLGVVQAELRAAVEQAFLQARAEGRSVLVALEGHTPACRARHPAAPSGELPPLILPRRVRWGLPPAVPLPPDAEASPETQRSGRAQACITVTPERTAVANAWYLTDGQDAVYLGLSGHGRITLLRWRQHLGRWGRI